MSSTGCCQEHQYKRPGQNTTYQQAEKSRTAAETESREAEWSTCQTGFKGVEVGWTPRVETAVRDNSLFLSAAHLLRLWWWATQNKAIGYCFSAALFGIRESGTYSCYSLCAIPSTRSLQAIKAPAGEPHKCAHKLNPLRNLTSHKNSLWQECLGQWRWIRPCSI